ncbi:MAG: hypothetical protein JST68_26755 [Bacteroidetes bacterium]|nr:hypothetical protein [Bacteroidota bacterium]
MNNRLEQFVRDHREDFDTEEPDSKIWEKISQDMEEPAKKKPAPLVRMQNHWIKWSAAAAVIILIGGAALWYFNRAPKGPAGTEVAQKTTPATENSGDNRNPANNNPANNNPAAQSNPDSTTRNLAGTTPSVANPANPDPGKTNDLASSMNEEMYHSAKLVEIKHKELKAIQKDEPLLYKQFSADVYKLDSVFHNLQVQLPTNPNREQLLEAMLQNLQLQMGLLNHQLEIVKQINHSKKTEYEKAYKTI